MAASTTDVVRVSVVHADRRVDVALPASLPVVEFLPEVTRSLGVDVPSRWERLGAGVLDPASGLGQQGVRDGEVLLVLAADDPAGLDRFDDLGEAVRVVAAAEFPRWHPAWSASALGLVAATAAGLLALVLPLLGRTATVSVALPVMLLVLLAAGVRTRSGSSASEEVVAVVVASLHAVVAGLALAGSAAPGRVASPVAGGAWWWGLGTSAPWVGAGASLLVLGVLAAACLHGARWAAVVPALVGAAWVGAAGLATLLDVEPGVPLTAVAAAVVLVGRAVPSSVLEATVVRGDRERSGAVDLGRLRRDLRLAHALVASGVVVQTVLVLVAVPYAVSVGLPGALWVFLLVGLLALRCRHEVVRAHVVLQASCAVLCGLWLLGTVVVRPDGVVPAVVALLLVGAVAAGSQGLSPRTAPRLAWLLDGVERLLVVAVLPGWVVVSGVVPGWPGP